MAHHATIRYSQDKATEAALGWLGCVRKRKRTGTKMLRLNLLGRTCKGRAKRTFIDIVKEDVKLDGV